MNFKNWLSQQVEIVVTPINQAPAGKALIQGQPNYLLEAVSGIGAAKQIEDTIGPVTKTALERLRDQLNKLFPPEQPAQQIPPQPVQPEAKPKPQKLIAKRPTPMKNPRTGKPMK